MWGEELVTARRAAELAQREPATIRYWVTRGWLTPAGRRGRATLYRTRDVLNVERDTRRRAVDTRLDGASLRRRSDGCHTSSTAAVPSNG